MFWLACISGNLVFWLDLIYSSLELDWIGYQEIKTLDWFGHAVINKSRSLHNNAPTTTNSMQSHRWDILRLILKTVYEMINWNQWIVKISFVVTILMVFFFIFNAHLFRNITDCRSITDTGTPKVCQQQCNENRS